MKKLWHWFIKRTVVFQEIQSKLWQCSAERRRLTKENVVLQERLPEISRRLCHVDVQQGPSEMHRILRICLTLDSRIIEEGFLHGNDDKIIEMFGHDIGHRAAYEIRRANFQRWEY